jgi:cyanophycinase-like exopeptidase
LHLTIVETHYLSPHPSPQTLLDGASAMFITGGDQSKYLDFWNATSVATALSSRRVTVGGSSAGLAVRRRAERRERGREREREGERERERERETEKTKQNERLFLPAVCIDKERQKNSTYVYVFMCG